MEFPHLKNATNFPNIDNVDVYAYKNNFNYLRWEADTKIKLCNVLYNSDYSDIVNFDTDDERDSYFNGLEGYSQILTSAFQVAPKDSIKLPIPYATAALYNYMFIDLPTFTSPQDPIAYEDTNRRIKRFFYFIEDIEQLSPSTTKATISLDIWTTYQNSIDFNYMILERGHAPVAAISVDDFLANPLGNNEYLLTEDINFSSAEICNYSEMLSFGGGDKFIAFSLPISTNDFLNLGAGYTDTKQGEQASFYNDSNLRYGYQFGVNGYDWNFSGYNYSDLNLKNNSFVANSFIDTNVIYCISAADATEFFSNLSVFAPHIYNSIEAVYIVSSDFVNTTFIGSVFNSAVYVASPINETKLDINLTKEKFSYPKEYEKLAKLYTFPYAFIEATDNNGQRITIKIENTTNLSLKQRVSLIYPYINLQAFFSGVNGSGESSYIWRNLQNAKLEKQIQNSDLYDFLISWDLPVFALYQNKEIDAAFKNYFSTEAERTNTIANYQNSVRSTNTNYENTIDSASTNYTNASASAETARTNTYASADTAVSNVTNSTNTSILNTALAVQSNIEINNNNISSNSYHNTVNNKTMIAAQAYDAAMQYGMTETDINAMAASTVVNGVASGVNGVVNAVASAATNPIGAVAGLLTTGVNIAASAANNQIAINSTKAKVDISVANSEQKLYSNTNTNTVMNDNKNLTMGNNITSSTSATTSQNANTAAMEKTNAANSASTTKGNATRSRDTSVANAQRSKNTTNANAQYSRNAEIENLQNSLNMQQKQVKAIFKNAKNDKPIKIISNSGDFALDVFEQRGIQIKIKTQTKAAIKSAGDYFLRFGYALNQNWNVEKTKLCVMKHFSYWKASEIWVTDGSGSNSFVPYAVKQIFRNGVTIWANADEIGKVSLYDNFN